MKLTNLMLLVGSATFAVACTDGSTPCGTDDTGCEETGAETDPEETDPEETDVEVDVTPEWNTGAWTNGWADFIDCGTAGEVTFTAETKNWGFNVALYVTQTEYYGEFTAWDEEHTLDEDSASDDNDGEGFSVFKRTLDTNATLPAATVDQAADVATLWGCGARGEGNASLDPAYVDDGMETAFALAVWAEGDSASDAPADCIYFGQSPDELADDLYTGGEGSSGSGRSIPSWFTKSGCTLVE